MSAETDAIRAAIFDSSGAPAIDIRARALDALDALVADAAAARQRETQLRQALEAVANPDFGQPQEDGPCWCDFTDDGLPHQEWCERARAALAAVPPPHTPPRPQKWTWTADVEESARQEQSGAGGETL